MRKRLSPFGAVARLGNPVTPFLLVRFTGYVKTRPAVRSASSDAAIFYPRTHSGAWAIIREVSGGVGVPVFGVGEEFIANAR